MWSSCGAINTSSLLHEKKTTYHIFNSKKQRGNVLRNQKTCLLMEFFSYGEQSICLVLHWW